MQIIPTNMTVVDYCKAMQRGEITVNREYQRSDKVWPDVARSFLIETILMNYPIPKLFLYQITDVKSRQTLKEVVDGQQRSMAILDFFLGKLRLSPTLELPGAGGNVYEQLSDDHKAAFLNYGLSFDLITAASGTDVREVFRRMNLYTIPLNPEEQRHAVFQGLFKWFVYRLARKYDDAFAEIGLFGPKQLVRMADTKLFTELAHAYIYGIKTTNKGALDALYKSRDETFPEEKRLSTRLTYAFDTLIGWPALHKTSLMKPYLIYSLILAIMHVSSPIKILEDVHKSPGLPRLDNTAAITNLSTLAEALDTQDETGKFKTFVRASSERTNVADQRKTRFIWFCRAISTKRI
jgi:Protein of unknown function DUF262